MLTGTLPSQFEGSPKVENRRNFVNRNEKETLKSKLKGQLNIEI